MSYQVIARKWRPQTFADVVGQQHVTRTLSNAIQSGRVAHAYIFSGARGVGKTTTARILAKALNCSKGPAAEPCNECDSCREISQGNSLDVIEIDAASNRGIDQIRELREMVRYAPAGGRYKVVILDEAHALTGEASNALLKTL
jgi:DNA polymerase-3 subunit gamma/tau